MASENNRHRLNRAKDMRAAWAKYERLAPGPIGEVQLRDMLADLMHFASANGIDFDHELSLATDFFGDETATPTPA